MSKKGRHQASHEIINRTRSHLKHLKHGEQYKQIQSIPHIIRCTQVSHVEQIPEFIDDMVYILDEWVFAKFFHKTNMLTISCHTQGERRPRVKQNDVFRLERRNHTWHVHLDLTILDAMYCECKKYSDRGYQVFGFFCQTPCQAILQILSHVMLRICCTVCRIADFSAWSRHLFSHTSTFNGLIKGMIKCSSLMHVKQTLRMGMVVGVWIRDAYHVGQVRKFVSEKEVEVLVNVKDRQVKKCIVYYELLTTCIPETLNRIPTN